jgi:dihydroorotate dehydrogenase
VSSPNTPGLRGLQDRGALEELLGRVGQAAKGMEAVVKNRPMFLKVAPDLDDKAIADIADVTKAAPYLHGLIVSNTTIARPDTLQGAHRGEQGGLSGAPLMEASTAVLKAFAGELNGALDLIGAGGVASGADAWRKIRAGASAVQLYSALAYEGPQLVRRIKAELVEIMQAEGVTRLSDAVGRG